MTATATATVTVNTSELAELVYKARAGQKVTIVYDSPAENFMNKGRGDNRNPYLAHVVKRTTARGRWAGSKTYTTGVNSARVNEGNDDVFIAQSHRHADHYDKSAVLVNRKSGKLYAGFTMKESDPTEYSTYEFIDTRTGQTIDPALWAQWAKPAKSSDAPASQELDDNAVHFRNPSLDIVREVRTSDTVYKHVPAPAGVPMTIAGLRTRLGQNAPAYTPSV